MKKIVNRYVILAYMSRRSRYPVGVPRDTLEKLFDRDMLLELTHYNYLEACATDHIRIGVGGREALNVHILTVVNVAAAVLALFISVLALLIK